jgi:hypothetical protein
MNRLAAQAKAALAGNLYILAWLPVVLFVAEKVVCVAPIKGRYVLDFMPRSGLTRVQIHAGPSTRLRR